MESRRAESLDEVELPPSTRFRGTVAQKTRRAESLDDVELSPSTRLRGTVAQKTQKTNRRGERLDVVEGNASTTSGFSL